MLSPTLKALRRTTVAAVILLIVFVTLHKTSVRIFTRTFNHIKLEHYSYYICTQIYNESEHYLADWLDHQFNVVGFKNVCVINTGQPLSGAIRQKFPFAYVEKKNRDQEFGYCLKSCFVDEPMRAEDMLMIHDVDEYLNVRQNDVIFRNRHKYELFHFTEVRYGSFLSCVVSFLSLWRYRFCVGKRNRNK